ncbi:hypothetical protein N499_0233A, partial [Wolbachia pipientis wVitA]
MKSIRIKKLYLQFYMIFVCIRKKKGAPKE